METVKCALLLIVLCCAGREALAQFAIVDIAADDKGILIPRLDFNNAPAMPENGLLIYVTANGPDGNDKFYYFNGTNWTSVGRISLPNQTAGDMLYFDGDNWVRLPKGTEGQILIMKNDLPQWKNENKTMYYIEEF